MLIVCPFNWRCCIAAALVAPGEPHSSVRIEEVTISRLGRWGEWCEKQLAPQVSKSTIHKWLWFHFGLLRLVGWRGHSEWEQGSSSLPELGFTCWWSRNLSVGWGLTLWPWLVLGQARHGKEGGRQHKPCLGRDSWRALKGRETWKLPHGQSGSQRCKEMVTRWNVGELCKKWCLKGWGVEAVGYTWWRKKFCVSFFPFCSLWTCSRPEPLLPTNSFIFLLRNTSLNLGETVSMWRQSSCEMWSSHCCDPEGHSQYIFISLSTSYMAGCGARHPSEEELSPARESDTSNFIIEGEESLPGLPQGIHWVL